MTHSRMRRFVWTALVGLAALALVTGAWSYATNAGEAAPAAPKAAAKTPGPRVVPDNLEFLKDVVYGKVGDRELKLDILRPKQPPAEPMPVVVYIHGGGWAAGNKASMPGLCNRLADQGYFCVSVGYRFSQEAVFPAQIEDTKCAIRFLRAHAKEYKINPDRIGVWGHSAGGHLVALLGTAGDAKDLEGTGGWQDQSSRVQCVIDCFGPTDFSVIPKGLEGVKEQMSSPIAKLLGVPGEGRQGEPHHVRLEGRPADSYHARRRGRDRAARPEPAVLRGPEEGGR